MRPAILAREDAVCARNGLHESVCLHGLVDVEGREAFHIEAGEPHGTDDSDPERVLWVLEGILHGDAFAIGRSGNPVFITARCGMMSKPHRSKSRISFCASLMMISINVLCHPSHLVTHRMRFLFADTLANVGSA